MIGLDAKIEILRARFAAKLFVGSTYASYGRAFITKKKDKNGNFVDIPELQTSSTVKYAELLPNRKIDGHSFFLQEGDIEKTEDGYTANVGIYFSVNLNELYSSVTERAVEYLHRDAIKQIENYSFKVIRIVPDLPAFEKFGLVKDTDNMEPYYLCRFDTEIEYKLNCN